MYTRYDCYQARIAACWPAHLDHTARPVLRTEYVKTAFAISSMGETSCLEPHRFRGYTFLNFAVGAKA